MKLNRHMKFVFWLVAAGFFSTLTARASDSSNTPALSATTGQQNLTAYPAMPYKLDQPETGNSGNWKTTRIFSRIMGAFKSIGRATAEEVRSDIIIRYGKDSSRAWTTIACTQPNPTLFGDCRVHEPNFGVGFH
jgi:hypothetical protein